jgi:hypothetical protein
MKRSRNVAREDLVIPQQANLRDRATDDEIRRSMKKAWLEADGRAVDTVAGPLGRFEVMRNSGGSLR